MTYGVGILVQRGLVMLADTRTNAGLDNIATFRKLHVFERPGAFVCALATAGNLSVTQSVLTHLREGLDDPQTGERARLIEQTRMFDAARLVGRAIRHVYAVDGGAIEQHASAFDVTILVGGQMAGNAPRLFMVYRAGNFIEATPETPFLQVGEHKYGKPILDRAVTFETPLAEAVKLSLISMDSTVRSNLGVGLPIDLAVIRRDAMTADSHRIDGQDPYFADLRERWSGALRAAHAAIPAPPYGAGPTPPAR